MNKWFNRGSLTLVLALSLIPAALNAQSHGLKTITMQELKYHLEFLGAREFRGRETPSPELDIATLYVANWARNEGLKPLMPGGSYYQPVPVTITSVYLPGTVITYHGNNGDRQWYWGRDFGGNFTVSGSYSGEVVFGGPGIRANATGSAEQADIDPAGKVVIILDVPAPGEVLPTGPAYYSRLGAVIAGFRARGASAVLSVVSPGREAKYRSGFNIFDDIPSGRMGILYDSQRTDFSSGPVKGTADASPGRPFEVAEISHELAAELLGVGTEDIAMMFNSISKGTKPPSVNTGGGFVRLDVTVDKRKGFSRNVVAMIEGSDPVLKNEYVVICGHPDGLGLREGEVLPGADDNCTATVALIAIGKALMAERPRRSVILGWFTGEEKWMNGSHYFINNCPVPVDRISACLNMDMLGRNSTDSLFLVCSDLMSSELDASIRRANKTAGINFTFDYTYSDISHPLEVYFRSDHVPFMRFGIPSVWFFSGFTPDYHTPRDGTEAVNYEKFLKVTRLVYATALGIGNRPALLKLDVNPKVTSRGEQNVRESSLYRK